MMQLKQQGLKKMALIGSTLAAVGFASPAMAGPFLSWWHFYPNISQSACMTRARGALASERLPLRRSDNDSVWTWNESVTASIGCLNQGSRLQVVIVVSSDNADTGEYVTNMLRTGMRTGVFD